MKLLVQQKETPTVPTFVFFITHRSDLRQSWQVVGTTASVVDCITALVKPTLYRFRDHLLLELGRQGSGDTVLVGTIGDGAWACNVKAVFQ